MLFIRLVEWTPSEWDAYEQQSIAIPIVGAILSGLLMVSFALRKGDWRDNYLVFLFTVLSFVAAVASCVVNNNTFEHRFCYDNAVQSNQVDNPMSVCVVQGVILTYTLLACCAIGFMMILDAFLKLNEWYAVYDHIGWVAFQLFFSLILPLIPVIIAGALKYYGFSRTQPFCFVQNYPYGVNNAVTGLVDLPVLIVTILTTLVFIACCVSYYQLKRREKTEPQDPKHRLIILYHVLPAMIFVFMMFAVWFGYVIAKGALYGWNKSRWIPSIYAFAQCLFTNYGSTGNSDAAYAVSAAVLVSVQVAHNSLFCFYAQYCGPHPTRRPDGGLVSWLIVCLTGKSIIVAAVYLTVWLVRTFAPILPEPTPDNDIYSKVARPHEKLENQENTDHQGELVCCDLRASSCGIEHL